MEKEHNFKIKNILISIGVIFLYLFAKSFPIEILSALGIKYLSLSSISKQICLILYEILLAIIIIYIYRKNIIPNIKDFKKNAKVYLDKYFKYWILILILMFISNLLITIFTSSITSQNQEIINNTLVTKPIYIIISTSLTLPVIEELIFRLSLRNIFKNNIIFIIISGLIFGSMHVIGTSFSLIDLLYVIPYSIPGFIFAYIYTKEDNICIPISMHIIHNTSMIILQLIALI